MNQLTYLSKRVYLYQRAMRGLTLDMQHLDIRFLLTSANLQRCFPDIPLLKHETIFREILLNQSLSQLELRYPDIFSQVQYIGDVAAMMRQVRMQPSVICTFHCGSYRLIHRLLLDHDIKYSMVIAGDVLSKEHAQYDQSFEWLYKDKAIANKPDFIRAESSSVAREMIRALQNGRSLLIYLDGNSGNQRIDKSDTLLIPFGEGHLFARTGAATIASIVNVPMIPVLCGRDSQDNPVIYIHKGIQQEVSQTKKTFVGFAITTIYRLLERLIKNQPSCWEAWMYLHHFMHLHHKDGRKKRKQTIEMFNERAYGLFKLGAQAYLFDRSTLESKPISAVVYRLLNDALLTGLSQKDSNNTNLLWLKNTGVLQRLNILR